jgi:NAD(P)-dependent dehydrogenase (short-subunit alcohol dehydrogenase family)
MVIRHYHKYVPNLTRRVRFRPIDVWINNAMMSVFSPVQTMEAAEYRRVMELPTSVSSTAPWPRCGAYARATGGSSFKSARRG